MSVNITFLGAAGTVTGSKYLVKYKNFKLLVDAGIFQGSHEWSDRNWDNPTFSPKEIKAVLLTHAHLDHIGMLPRYVSQGLNCSIYCTAATRDLARILLLDMAQLQEQEADYRNKNKKSRFKPALPLFTKDDAIKTLKLLKVVSYQERLEVSNKIFASWKPMGHILGSASITLEIGSRIINFSGDIGRYEIPILVDPEPVKLGDLLLIESTYGDTIHKEKNINLELQRIIKETISKKGVVLVPSFAVGRTQLLLYYLRELKAENMIPDIPIIIDSPMAGSATEIYKEHFAEYDRHCQKLLKANINPFSTSKLYFTKNSEESKSLNRVNEPMIIISASGMLTGGRILHHLIQRLGNSRNTILFVGFQPPGGRGNQILSGAKTINIFGERVTVNAQIENISGLSAHADKDELIKWCRSCQGVPTKTAIVHGEPEAAKVLANTLNSKLKFNAFCPGFLQTLDI